MDLHYPRGPALGEGGGGRRLGSQRRERDGPKVSAKWHYPGPRGPSGGGGGMARGVRAAPIGRSPPTAIPLDPLLPSAVAPIVPPPPSPSLAHHFVSTSQSFAFVRCANGAPGPSLPRVGGTRGRAAALAVGKWATQSGAGGPVPNGGFWAPGRPLGGSLPPSGAHDNLPPVHSRAQSSFWRIRRGGGVGCTGIPVQNNSVR